MKSTLLVMAAGLGSRFGGVKQLAKVGANGEAFLDLSISDAIAAGFTEVVMIIRSEIEQDVRDHLGETHPQLDITFVRQDDLGPPRAKPWGTTHAIVSAAKAVESPFCVINADDYYGPASFALAATALKAVTPDSAATVAFELGKTLPPSGSVSRGICEVDEGRLVSIFEAETCQANPDGTVSANGETVDPLTPASMNMWCFHHDSMADLHERWLAFHALNTGSEKAECQLPTVVSELMGSGQLAVSVTASPEQWIGITNPEDYELAKQALANR